MDKFYTNTLTQKYICNLLQNTELPLVDFVEEGDFIIKDVLYIYLFQYIVCTKTGALGEDGTYTVLEHYLPWRQHIKYTRTHLNNNGFYDGDTHRVLGNYLRTVLYNNKTNLMGMYNCYNCTSANDIYVKSETVEDPQEEEPSVVRKVERGKTNRRVVLVPIKYNKTYTVSVESKSQLFISPVLYCDNDLVKIQRENGDMVDATNTYLKHIKTMPMSIFNEPWTFNVALSKDVAGTDREEDADKILKQLYDRQKDLYLMIDMAYSNKSTIIVLEGDYAMKHNDGYEVKPPRGEYLYYSPLLQMYNMNFDIPYSENLIQYLLSYAVFNNEDNDYNIRKLRQKLGLSERGDYDDQVRGIVFNSVLNSHKTFKADIYGYLDSNAEKVIQL